MRSTKSCSAAGFRYLRGRAARPGLLAGAGLVTFVRELRAVEGAALTLDFKLRDDPAQTVRHYITNVRSRTTFYVRAAIAPQYSRPSDPFAPPSSNAKEDLENHADGDQRDRGSPKCFSGNILVGQQQGGSYRLSRGREPDFAFRPVFPLRFPPSRSGATASKISLFRRCG